ncbi:xylulose-5-phosphate phosphoketolase [Verticillium dahliae]|nr:xylulose-5-phosphate phosphoketolase [Verticillium dahliae]
MADSKTNGASTEESISPYGPARSTVKGEPLSQSDLAAYNDWFKASLYLSLGMIYLRENPLLKEPLTKDHLKLRLLGHFGSAPGQIFTWMHFNRLINKHDLDAVFISGPGHGAPAVLSQSYLEGVYSEVYHDCSEDAEGLQRFFKQFSFPGGIGSHATPETPGSLHEGGELGYAISHAFGAVFDHPDLIALTMVGDGEAETGPMATSWHSTKFLNPKVDGAVLPVLHLNGYKINNPTLLARITHKELENLFLGYGWQPYFVEGDDVDTMHQAMAATLEHCVDEIRRFQKQARDSGKAFRPRWPMIILRSPKGWTGPRKIGDNFLEGYWRAHQVPITDVATNPDHLQILEKWMKSYEPDRLFKDGRILPELKAALAPKGNRRMSANPVANGGLLRKPLRLPDFKKYALAVDKSAATTAASMSNMAGYLRDVVAMNPHSFRLFGPDETESNKLGKVYEAAPKVWLGEYFDEDANGGNLAMEGRVMEMLSEHTCEGWLEGYILTGRHGMLNSYEPFIPIVSSMVNQHCKWLEKCLEVEWRHKVASLNILLTAVVWRQDHNGFTHQDPGFLDTVVNKSPDVVRCVNVVDLFKLIHHTDHSHGLTDAEWTALFTDNVPVIFNFHSYPWLVHRLTYKRPGAANLHVRGYKEKGNIDTPLELAIRNQTDRFSLAIDAIDRIPSLHNRGAAARETLRNEQIRAKNVAFETGLDPPFLKDWQWRRRGLWQH